MAQKLIRKKAFTIIELLLVVTILSTISLLTTSFYARFFSQNGVLNTVDQFSGSFRKAQMYSMMGKQNNSWGVHYQNNRITLFQGTTYASRTTAFDENFTVPSSVLVTGFVDVIFVKVTGLPSATPTITISSGNTSKTITINSQGVINK